MSTCDKAYVPGGHVERSFVEDHRHCALAPNHPGDCGQPPSSSLDGWRADPHATCGATWCKVPGWLGPCPAAEAAKLSAAPREPSSVANENPWDHGGSPSVPMPNPSDTRETTQAPGPLSERVLAIPCPHCRTKAGKTCTPEGIVCALRIKAARSASPTPPAVPPSGTPGGEGRHDPETCSDHGCKVPLCPNSLQEAPPASALVEQGTARRKAHEMLRGAQACNYGFEGHSICCDRLTAAFEAHDAALAAKDAEVAHWKEQANKKHARAEKAERERDELRFAHGTMIKLPDGSWYGPGPVEAFRNERNAATARAEKAEAALARDAGLYREAVERAERLREALVYCEGMARTGRAMYSDGAHRFGYIEDRARAALSPSPGTPPGEVLP